MRRVAIWSGCRYGYRRFGVGIGVGIGDLEWVSEWVTATVYLQPSRAEASPLSLIGDG